MNSSSPISRCPPYDEKAECAVIGSVMLEPKAMHVAINNSISPEDFYIPAHCKIWDACIEMYSSGRPIDIITLTSALREKKDDNSIMLLTRMVDSIPELHRIQYYIDILKDKSIRRMAISEAVSVLESAYDEESQTGDQVIAEAQTKFFGLSKLSETPTTNTEALNIVLGQWASAAKGEVIGLPCFLKDVNGYLGNFRKGKVYFVGATPGAGKSTWLSNQFSYWSVIGKIPTAINSIEMDHPEFIGRIVAERADQSTYVMSRGIGGFEMSKERINRVIEKSKELINIETGEMVSPIWINDKQMSVEELMSWAQFMVSRHGIQALGVDYLQILHPGSKHKSASKREEVMYVVDCLRRMAKQLNIVLIVLSQLTKDGRDERKPRASDLKESSEIQDAAYGIFMLYEWEGIWYCDLQKNRGGPTYAVPCHFAKDRQRWMQNVNEPRDE